MDVLEFIQREDTHAKQRYLQAVNVIRADSDDEELEEGDRAKQLKLMEKKKAARVKRFKRMKNLCSTFGRKSISDYMSQVIGQLAL